MRAESDPMVTRVPVRRPSARSSDFFAAPVGMTDGAKISAATMAMARITMTTTLIRLMPMKGILLKLSFVF